MQIEIKSNPLAGLPEDLIAKILSRLPSKSLLRFKCVSRRWCSLISDPKFAKIQIQLQRTTEGNKTSSPRIIIDLYGIRIINCEALDDGEDDSVVMQLHTVGRDDRFVLGGHCDGIVCLSNREVHMLYNPTNRQSRIVPSDNLPMPVPHLTVGLFAGFGYDPTAGVYKIIEGMSNLLSLGFEEAVMDIFTLGPNSWRRIPNSRVTCLIGVGIYMNGALHWPVDHDIDSKRVSAIASFDLTEEMFKEVLQLPDGDRKTDFEGLGLHGTRLLYYVTWRDRLKGWIMNEYGNKESWVELFDVTIREVTPRTGHWPMTVCYTKNQNIVFTIDGPKMSLFDSDDSTSELFPVKARFSQAIVYVESLVSPYVGYHIH